MPRFLTSSLLCRVRTLALGCLAGLAFAAVCGAQGAFLVRDLEPVPVNDDSLRRYAVEISELGGFAYFAAAHPRTGRELWRTDGTAEGTRLVADLCPGPCSSEPKGFGTFDGRLYFFADDGVVGSEPWSTDGTPEGTRLLGDLCAGDCGSALSFDAGFELFEGHLYFAADDGWRGSELWRTDGTRHGTRLLHDLCPGPCGSEPTRLLTAPGQLFFQAEDETSRWAWRTDGTLSGARALVDLCDAQGCTGSAEQMLFGNRLAVLPWATAYGRELWLTDGSAQGTGPLLDLCPGQCSGVASIAWELGGLLYFTGAATPSSGAAIYRTDGTITGTEVFLDASIVRASDDAARIGSIVYFPAADTSHGSELWRTDGSQLGTYRVADLSPGPADSSPELLTPAGGQVYFVANRDQLWASDGTAQGTLTLGTFDEPPGGLSSLGEALLFAGATPGSGTEPWISDGTLGGTTLLREIHHGPGSSEPTLLTPLGERLIFAAEDSGVWSSDATQAGTVRIGLGPRKPATFFPHAGSLLYTAAYAAHSDEWGLWRTDGTPAGTELLVPDLIDVRGFFETDTGLLMAASSRGQGGLGTGNELWFSDLSDAGTYMVKDIVPGYLPIAPPEPLSSSPEEMVPIDLAGDSTVILGLRGNFIEREPWRTDGSEAGTQKLSDICTNYCSSDPKELTRLGKAVVFAATDELTGRELWRTDGTEAGTFQLADLRFGLAGSSPHHLTRLGDEIFFFAQGGDTGEQLWATDGSSAGTRLVKDLMLGPFPTHVSEARLVGRRIFFSAFNESTGIELWVSDGSTIGTRLVDDIEPGPRGSYPATLTAVGNLLAFAAKDTSHGHELWITDGTARGTRLADDIAPGPTPSSPAELTLAGEWLFFRAEGNEGGRELWAIDQASLSDGVAILFRDGFESGDTGAWSRRVE